MLTLGSLSFVFKVTNPTSPFSIGITLENLSAEVKQSVY